MSFGQPLALLGLVLIPVIVAFYLWRARHSRQVVSSTWLWSEALVNFSHHPHRRLPLRNPLLPLQILAVLVLSLIVAAPRFSQPARLHEIVVLDGSAAMAATDVTPSRFALAQRQVKAMIERLGPDDSLSLILAGAQAQAIGEIPGNIDLASAVGRLDAPSGAADIAGASALALGEADEPGLGVPRVTYLAAPETPLLQTGSLPVTVDRIGRDPLDDQSIGTLTIGCQPGGTACEAFARVRNTANAARSDELQVWAGRQSLGHQVLHLPARGSLDLTFSVPRGAQTVKAALLSHDADPGDNTAWAIVPAVRRLRALFVSDDPGQMLAALHAIPGLTVKVVSTADFQYGSVPQYDLLILDKGSPDGLPPIPMLIIDPEPSSSVLSVRAGDVFLPVDDVDMSDPLVQGLDLFGLSTTGERVAPPSWAHVVVGGKSGPLLMAGELNGARAVVLTFDAGHSSFAQNLAFPLLVTRLVSWLVPAPPVAVAAGTSVWLPPDVQSVQDPTGAVVAGPMVDVSEPGVYAVATGTGSRVAGDPLFVASAPAPGDATTALAGRQGWTPVADIGSRSRDLWPLVMVLALLALSAEWWFYARQT